MGTCGVHGRTVAELTACAGAELRAGDSAAEQAGNVRILGVSEVHTEVRLSLIHISEPTRPAA